MFSTPETSVHVRDKNREISPLESREGYGGKDLEKRWVLRREWKTPMRHANHRFRSRVGAWEWTRALWGGRLTRNAKAQTGSIILIFNKDHIRIRTPVLVVIPLVQLFQPLRLYKIDLVELGLTKMDISNIKQTTPLPWQRRMHQHCWVVPLSMSTWLRAPG